MELDDPIAKSGGARATISIISPMIATILLNVSSYPRTTCLYDLRLVLASVNQFPGCADVIRDAANQVGDVVVVDTAVEGFDVQVVDHFC